MGTLTRAQIDAADDLPRKAVDVPEWGGQVFLRTLSAAAAKELVKIDATTNEVEAVSAYLAQTLCDETGQLLFAGENDLEALKKKQWKVLKRLFDSAAEQNAPDADEKKSS